MWCVNRPTLLTIVGAPLLLFIAGGAAGRLTRPDDHGAASTSGRSGVPLPTGAAFDAFAPVRPLGSAPHHVVYDRTDLVGYQTPRSVEVPTAAALPLDKGPTTPIDLTTMQPAAARHLAAAPLPDATPVAAVKTPAPPPSTVAPPVAPRVPTSTTIVRSEYVDPCVAPTPDCVGVAAQVRNSAERSPNQLDPLRMTLPFAAADGVAPLCSTIEQPVGVPDPYLSPAMRPTVAVAVNQPSIIALTGTWADGGTLEKLTLVTLPAHDALWKTALTSDHRQHDILACLTLPLDTVRPHATGGHARLNAHLLAISATGRTEIDGPVELDVPIDGEDLRFADQMRFGDLGLQRQTNGTMAPTVHVHYAFTSDTMVAAGHFDPRSTRIYDRHALVENADCAGWANNQQGIDRSIGSSYRVSTEQRTISGRPRPVTVVDGDIRLDPTAPAGWQGYLCTQVLAADGAGNHETLVLRGAEVRSPLTPTYTVGAVVDDSTLPTGARLSLTFTRADRLAVCNSTVQTLSVDARGATCTVLASGVPSGVVVGVQLVGAQQRAAAVTIGVPINLTGCNPDDLHGADTGGCSTGYRQGFELPTSGGGAPVHAVLVVDRDAKPGSMSTNPAHQWQIGDMRSFTF
jgi:hypothetical protein